MRLHCNEGGRKAVQPNVNRDFRGESFSRSDVAALVDSLRDRSWKVGTAALRALVRLTLRPEVCLEIAQRVLEALRSPAEGGASGEPRLEIIDAAGRLPVRSVRERLCQIAGSDDDEQQCAAMRTLALARDPRVAPHLIARLIGRDAGETVELERLAEFRRNVPEWLARLDVSSVRDEIRAQAGAAEDGNSRFWLSLALARSGDTELVDEVFAQLDRGELDLNVGWAYDLQFGPSVRSCPPFPQEISQHFEQLAKIYPRGTMASDLLSDLLFGGNAAETVRAEASPNKWTLQTEEAMREELRWRVPELGSIWPREYDDPTAPQAIDPLIKLEPAEVGSLAASLFEGLLREAGDPSRWIMSGNAIIAFVNLFRIAIPPDSSTLTRLFDSYLSAFDKYVNLDESWPTLRWQIAWTASHAALRDIIAESTRRLSVADERTRIAAARFVEEAVRYRPQAYGPQFGGGAEPPDADQHTAELLEHRSEEAGEKGAASFSDAHSKAGSVGEQILSAPVRVDENVQFTVYRPRSMPAQKWCPVLAFAHLAERRPDTPDEASDPIGQVRQQAARILGDATSTYGSAMQDSRQAVPRDGDISFVLEFAQLAVNPRQRSFRWLEDVHREEFRVMADTRLEGQTVRGRLTVYLGGIILAEVNLAIRVDSREVSDDQATPESSHSRPYRSIFPSYSHKDTWIVQQCERTIGTLGDRYLRDATTLRAGEVWSARLRRLIDGADVFQLFWSRHSMSSSFVRQEWEYALTLNRPNFIRPTYWDDPMPSAEGLPPPSLKRLHFQRLPLGDTASSDDTKSITREMTAAVPDETDGITTALIEAPHPELAALSKRAVTRPRRPSGRRGRRAMPITSLAVEYQRFGDSHGVVRVSDRYIRTVGGTEPTREVSFGLPQEDLTRAMASLNYGEFRNTGASERAERMLARLAPLVEQFLLDDTSPAASGALVQIEVVTRLLELAQLPFEIIEEFRPNLVVTRRIRHPWPPPAVVEGDRPRILFAWAEPRHMDVPHERHRRLLDEVVRDLGGANAIVEVRNATRAKLEAALSGAEKYTHVHLLVHGVANAAPEEYDIFDTTEESLRSAVLALETEDGMLDRCPPDALAGWLGRGLMPQAATIAMCRSAEVDPIASGATMAHMLHDAGIPVVIASQLALTKDGSDFLVSVFLKNVIEGEDPRRALRRCRDELRTHKAKTYYDRVALVGYVHVDPELDELLNERRFRVALMRLKAISAEACARVDRAIEGITLMKELSAKQFDEVEQIRRCFDDVRNMLASLELDRTLTETQREELLGLHASSLKREAEAAWSLARRMSGFVAEEWRERSRNSLRGAAEAYGRAAKVLRDHHWTWVQWLVLLAVEGGTLTAHDADWITAKAAATDAAGSEAPDGASPKERRAIAEDSIWGFGSLSELHLLAPLVGKADATSKAKACLDALVAGCRTLGTRDAIDATHDQLARYRGWWAEDPTWKLPPEIVTTASDLREYLLTISKDTP